MSRKLSSALRILPARSVNKTAIRFVATRRRRAASTLLSIESDLTVTGSVSRAKQVGRQPGGRLPQFIHRLHRKNLRNLWMVFGLTGRAGHGGRWTGRQLFIEILC